MESVASKKKRMKYKELDSKLILLQFQGMFSQFLFSVFAALWSKKIRGDHGPGQGRGKKNLPIGRVGPDQNLGRIFVSKACYFGPKLSGFCGPKRAGPKNRLKSRFWLAQSPPEAK